MAEKVNIAFDACSLINLINGHQLDTVLSLSGYSFIIGPAVYKEISKKENQKNIIDKACQESRLFRWNQEVNVDFLLRLFSEYNLGDGETEAIAMCFGDKMYICCDDKKARSAANIELGKSYVMGSLRLLKESVEQDIIKCTEAKFCYLEMQLKGGFLPANIEHDYFCKAA